MNKIFTQLVKKRGLNPDFLQPDYKKSADPFLLPDMEPAVARIKKAIENQEKILIYGDYDADGVTASTVMEQALTLAGLKPENISIMLPDRFADGYGMSPKLITRAKGKGASLIITVDCGSRNFAIVDELNCEKIDSIITDHHETEEALPAAVAIVNPKRKDYKAPENTGLDHLAGVGVAFKLAQALVKKSLIPDGQEKWLLDLVLIGTICDSMTMDGENRILCYYGMKVLEKTRRPGLKELMRSAGIKTLDSDAIGFQIGPRINAAGRLETAEIALDLLRAASPVKADALAAKLEELNKRRKTEQNNATRDIKDRGLQPGPVIIETGRWHEGIVGIVAGRLVEDYHKPAFVLTEVAGDIYKGSGRSFGDFNLAEALIYAKDTIIGGGGHAGAAGVKVESKNLYAFREKINHYYNELNLKDQEKFLLKTPDLTVEDFADLNFELFESLKNLQPYGPGNEEPLLRLKNIKVKQIALLGAEKKHLRLDVIDKNNRSLKLMAFFAPKKWLDLAENSEGAEIEPIITLAENNFRGVKTLEARIVDLHILDSAE